MDFRQLFDSFSRRSEPRKEVRALTNEFRVRVIMLCNDTFPADSVGFGDSYFTRFWTDARKRMAYQQGKPSLSDAHSRDPFKDAVTYLTTCSDPQFLDFVELIFRTDVYFETHAGERLSVETINDFLRLDDLPYALTPLVWESTEESLFGRQTTTFRVAEHPRVIRRDDEVVHREAIEPTLALLAHRQFTSANHEFLEALSDFRKGDYGDCLTKCGSSFESTMKIICARHGWPYGEKDTASVLLKTVIERSNLDPFFQEPLMIVATLRNRLSKSHGAGTQQRLVSGAKAKFAINSTAAAILLLVEHCG